MFNSKAKKLTPDNQSETSLFPGGLMTGHVVLLIKQGYSEYFF